MKPRTGERSAASRKVLYGKGNDGLTESDVGENEHITMSQKPFAMGVRVQHRQEDIDRAQYGFMNGSFAANVLKFKQVHRIYVCLPSTGR